MIRTTSVALALVAATAGVAAAGDLRHVPPAEATAGKPIEVLAEAPITGAVPTLHYRSPGQATYAALEFTRRPDNRWVAAIPATASAPPAVEYYIDREATPGFASASAPHSVLVRASQSDQRKGRDLERVGWHRSRMHAAGEYVDFGPTTMAGEELTDRYYRVDIDFGYRLLAYPLEEIRVGYTRLIGTVPDGMDEVSAGYKVGGWFELGVGVVEGVHLDGRVLVLATVAGFAVGGRGELRAGSRDGSHVAIGAETAADVGALGYFRLGWDTVPRVPMAATIEVGNLPAEERPTGVRLIYDAFIPVHSMVRLGLRAGYAARDQRVGGLTAGVGATVDF